MLRREQSRGELGKNFPRKRCKCKGPEMEMNWAYSQHRKKVSAASKTRQTRPSVPYVLMS